MNIKNKIATVTGGAGGMGFEISKALLINEAQVKAAITNFIKQH